MEKIYLATHHNRRTDDTKKVYKNREDAKTMCYGWIKKYDPDKYVFLLQEGWDCDYGDWCLFCHDDYYACVETLELN